MKSFLAFIVFSIAVAAWGSSADSLNTVVDLEAKITQKVKAILQPVDPDAIIVTKVEVKTTTTDILGTQLTAVGIFATGDLQKIEDTDIDSINVTVISKIEKMPPEISKYVETAVMGISKKGRVQFTRMDATTVDVIMKRQENQKIHAEGFQRLVYLVDQMYKKAGSGLLGLMIGFALVELVKVLMGGFFQDKSSTKLGNKIAAIKVGSTEDSAKPMIVQQANAGSPAGASRSGEVSIAGTAEKNPLELMSAESLRALFSDAYWCEKDNYAAWAWSQLSPGKKIELLESWHAFESYAVYLARIEPKEDRFHLDPSYLRPQACHQVANQDLLKVLKTNKSVWLSFSQLRRQSLPLNLQERVEFAKMPQTEAPGTSLGPKLWASMTSPLRKLPVQLGISTLTEQDEVLLMTNPDMITGAMRRQVPSLVWVALLPKTDREKLLQKVSAQNLAEAWVAPTQTLQLLLEVLPEKKRELLKDYAKKITPSRESPVVASLTNSALDIFENAAIPKATNANEKKVA